MNKETVDVILPALSYVAPIVIAWLAHSPLGSGLPAKVVKLLANLDPKTIRALLLKMAPLATDPSARYGAALGAVRELGKRFGLELSESDARKLLDWVVRETRAGNLIGQPTSEITVEGSNESLR